MIGFLIKKSFFDGWDNLIPSFLYNIICMGMVALYVFIAGALEEASIGIFFAVTSAFLLFYVFFNFGLAGVTFNWGHYQGTWGRGFFDAVKKHILHIMVFYLIAVFVFFDIAIIMPSYLASQNFVALFLVFVQIWVVLFIALAMQYYIPLCMFLEGRKPFFILKQCFVLTFDNLGYTFFVGIKTVFDFLLSALSFFFIPGLSFISLSHIDAVKLLHLRYRYADEHKCSKKDVNLYEMFEEERNDLGPRSIRAMFKPWKSGK